jgi:hypothetical protein
VDVRYGDVELLGYEIDDHPIRPGDLLDVTLYWRPLRQTDEPLSFFIQVFGPDGNWEPVEVGKLDSYPGRGLLTSDTWTPNQIYADHYRLELDHENATLPYEPRLRIGWRDNVTDEEIPATTLAGDLIETVVVRGGAVSAPLSDDRLVSVEGPVFGDMIEMAFPSGHYDETGIAIDVTWEALHPIPEDFTIFVQLVHEDDLGNPLAFGDGPPRDGWWPTSKWVPGHAFRDRFFISYAGPVTLQHRVLIGFYRPHDFTRLSVDRGDLPDAASIPCLTNVICSR